MKFKRLNCPQCGDPAEGTVERLAGVSLFSEPDEHGAVEYEGETRIWWDEQKTARTPSGRVYLFCGHCGVDWQTTELPDDTAN